MFIKHETIAQINVKVRWLDIDEDKYEVDTMFLDYQGAINYLYRYLLIWHNKGFLSADFDLLEQHNNCLYAFFYRGEQFFLGDVDVNSLDKFAQDSIRNFLDNIRNLPFSQTIADSILKHIYSIYRNHGYTNCNVLIDSIKFINRIYLSLSVEKGNIASLDTIVNTGDLHVLPEVIYTLALLRRGDKFSKEKMTNFEKKLHRINYLQQKEPTRIIFADTTFTLNIILKKRRNNVFEGILGIIPQYNNINTTRSFMISGDFTLRAVNLLNLLEKINIRWRRPAERSQFLKIEANLPVIPYLPFGVENQFFMQKIDTLYTNLANSVFIFYPHTTNIFVPGFTYKYFASSLITVRQYQFLTSLPPVSDSRYSIYGIKIQGNNYDYENNPLQGGELNLHLSLGEKRLLPLPQFNDEVYKDIQLRTIMFQGDLTLGYIIPIHRLLKTYIKVNAAFMKNKYLLENELYRLGGLFTFRGFDEDAFSVSSYAMQTIELRYIFERASRFVIFFETAYMEKIIHTYSQYFRPFSFGTGLVMNTQSGIFSLYWAIGTIFGETLYFRNSRIHFGYTIQF